MTNRLFLFIMLCLANVIAYSQANHETDTSRPFVIGVTTTIYSFQLGETRTLNIYLPPGYNKNDSIRYPVIYLLDGSADEDFIHVAGLLQFANFSWVKMFPPAIIIGIANVDRRRDFTFASIDPSLKKEFPTSGSSAKFIAFIQHELQPFVTANYRNNERKIIIGQSLGGLLATEIFVKQPSLFSDYIIISPSLWWDNERLLKSFTTLPLTVGKKVFIAVGKEGKEMETTSRKLAASIDQKNNQVYFKYFGKEDHASIMHLAVYEAFKLLH